jgi:hypothetical protein
MKDPFNTLTRKLFFAKTGWRNELAIWAQVILGLGVLLR